MGKKGNAGYAAADSGLADELMEAGEAHMAERRFAEALQSFASAAAAAPTRQLAWYNKGLAAAELWEEGEDVEGDQGRELLETAAAAFRKILELDTSKRAETRYLAAVAAGRLLVKAAERVEDLATGPDCGVLATEAVKNFEEAQRLVQEWGHADLGDAWGDWGRAVALQMRRQIANASPPAVVNWNNLLMGLSALCDQATVKFQAATEAAVDEGSDDEMDDDDSSDVRWMVLHVEHLAAFISFAVRAVTEANVAGMDTQLEWLRRGLLAWQEAVRLASAVVDLSAVWQHHALQGDIFTAGYNLLCDATPCLGSVVSTTETWRGLFGTRGVWMPTPPRSGDAVEAATAQLTEVDDEDLARLAEASYTAALASDVVDKGEVGLSHGELALSVARRARARSQDATSALQTAATSLQLVARFGTREEKATAWYNLACAAALADRPEKAGEALKKGLELTPAARRQDWLREASEDVDLRALVAQPDWRRALGV